MAEQKGGKGRGGGPFCCRFTVPSGFPPFCSAMREDSPAAYKRRKKATFFKAALFYKAAAEKLSYFRFAPFICGRDNKKGGVGPATGASNFKSLYFIRPSSYFQRAAEGGAAFYLKEP